MEERLQMKYFKYIYIYTPQVERLERLKWWISKRELPISRVPFPGSILSFQTIDFIERSVFKLNHLTSTCPDFQSCRAGGSWVTHGRVVRQKKIQFWWWLHSLKLRFYSPWKWMVGIPLFHVVSSWGAAYFHWLNVSFREKLWCDAPFRYVVWNQFDIKFPKPPFKMFYPPWN